MTAGDFDARIAELAERVGDGHLVASCEVDQVYAHYQHEGLDFEHPRGGQAKYLEEPWETHATQSCERLARGLLEPDGLHEAARQIALDGVTMVRDHAPVEFDNLRRSGHAKVVDDDTLVFDAPPEVPRLSEEFLRSEHRGSVEGP